MDRKGRPSFLGDMDMSLAAIVAPAAGVVASSKRTQIAVSLALPEALAAALLARKEAASIPAEW